MTPCRLITFRPSHYCEKARWALERASIPYVEESHVPVLSWLATFGAGARRTVPALVTASETVPDSTDILRWVDRQARAQPLFPGDLPEAAALEEDFDARLGPAARRIGYFHALPDRDAMRRLLSSAAPPWEARVGRMLTPVIATIIARGLRVNAEGAARSRRVLDDTFARVTARLADGRRYLTGDRFTAADLTFAALAYLVVWPEQLQGQLVPPLHELPAAYRAFIEEQRATTAGRFALRLWDEDRSCHARAPASAGAR